MRRENYELLKEHAKLLEDVADRYFACMDNPQKADEALSDFIDQTGVFHMYVENVLNDEYDNMN